MSEYTPLHLDPAELHEEIIEILAPSLNTEKLQAAFAKKVDEIVEEFVKRHIESLTIYTCCSGDGEVFVSYSDRSEEANQSTFPIVSMPLEDVLNDLDPSACDSREHQERFAEMLEVAAARFRSDDFFLRCIQHHELDCKSCREEELKTRTREVM